MDNNSKCAVCQSEPCTCSLFDSKELLFYKSGHQNHGVSIAIMGGRRRNVLDSAVASLHSLGIPAIALAGCKEKRSDGVRDMESTLKHFGRLDILLNAAAPDGYGIGYVFPS